MGTKEIGTTIGGQCSVLKWRLKLFAKGEGGK